MKMVQSSDYIVYFDDVRMDPFLKSWNTSVGLNASDAKASLRMHRTKDLEQWKGYLTQVRVFAKNNFSGKYGMIFEGELMNRSWGHSRGDTGELSFECKGFYHWLNVPIPFMIGDEEAFDHIQRFRYEAQNIDVERMQQLFQTEADIEMKGAPISEVITRLFDVMNAGYYIDDDSSFHWAKLKERIRVMGDIIPEFRESGYLDAFTFIRSSQIETFYVYLNTILNQMMFEFYQDRDGALRIKNPSWKDSILNAHVFDESVIQRTSGFDNWESEPTRVLVVGGMMDPDRNLQNLSGRGNQISIPMGLYIGTPSEGEYFQQNVDVLLNEFGVEGGLHEGMQGGSSGDFFNNLTPSSKGYSVSSPYGMRTHPIYGSPAMHKGTDFRMRYEPLYNIGTFGTVRESRIFDSLKKGGGRGIVIDQVIDGTDYSFVYFHLSEQHVNVGDRVAPGQQIGVTGNTGGSTGPHLHFEVWRGGYGSGAHINPVPFLNNMNTRINSAQVSGIGNTGSSFDVIPHLRNIDTSGNQSGGTGIQDYVNQDISHKRNLTAAQLNDWINSKVGSHRRQTSQMYNQGHNFFLAGQRSGLDPVYLASHAAVETAWGTSRIVRSRNNFYGIGAFDHDPGNLAHRFLNAGDGIIRGAEWIRDNYLNNGQNTLYKMRFDPSGSRNYATDPEWHIKIARTMKASGFRSGSSGGFSTATNVDTSPFSGTSGSPFQTRVSRSFSQPLNGREPLMTGQYQNYAPVNAVKPEPVNYMADARRGRTRYPIPESAKSYESYLKSDPNGVDHNMISAIIDRVSGWRKNHESNGRIGLMGVNQSYLEQALNNEKSILLDPELNIDHGSQIFKGAFDVFTEKSTFALASLYLGSIPQVSSYIAEAGSENFARVRAYMPDDVVSFVDSVIATYTENAGGNLISGDPHRDFVSDDGSRITESLARDTDVKDYEAVFRPSLSDEERLFKVNLKVSEQPLIRYDIPHPDQGNPRPNQDTTGNENVLDADALVQRYARYMMQLYRANSHGVSVNFTTAMPFIRPGFNAWLEPTRTDLVFYVTRVSHQGSFEQGSYATVNGAFLRETETYSDIEENIFVSESEVTASDFGTTVDEGDMEGVRERLRKIHEDDQVITDGRKAPVLNELYSSMNHNRFSTQWTQELTKSEIESEIKAIYDEAPPIIKERKAKLASIMRKSKKFFEEMLNKTRYE